MSDHISPTPHIERESAAYISGDNRDARQKKISRLWHFIKSHTDHYRAPGHHPISSPELVKNSRLHYRRSELHMDEKPGRHILYLDTLDLCFWRAAIQVRLEIKQKQRKGILKEAFAEVTLKIGQKAEQRLEEAVSVNLATWEKKGFLSALKAGMEADIKKAARKSQGDGIKVRRKFSAFKHAFRDALQSVNGGKLQALKPYPLVHLNRDTKETEFSPYDHDQTILEIKTDDCEWETVTGDTGEFAQIEIEHIQGDAGFFTRELESLQQHKEFGLFSTTDSKEDPGMRTLQTFLCPQEDSTAERARIAQNHQILMQYLKPAEFISLDPAQMGIQPYQPPAPQR